MYTVGVLGHSLLRPYLPGGSHYKQNNKKIVLNFHCASGATFSSILGTSAYSELVESSPDLVLLVLGGNDLVYGSEVSEVYSRLEYLVHTISESCSPQFGVFLVEIEQRIGDPRFVGPGDYNALRNSLIRKIRQKNFPRLLSITGYGVRKDLLSDDGVHFGEFGKSMFLAVLRSHISEILFDSEFDAGDL